MDWLPLLDDEMHRFFWSTGFPEALVSGVFIIIIIIINNNKNNKQPTTNNHHHHNNNKTTTSTTSRSSSSSSSFVGAAAYVIFLVWRTTNPGIYRDTIDQWLLMMIGGGSSYFPIYWGASSAGMTEVVLNTAQVASCPSHKGDNLPRELMITRVMNILLGGMTFQVRSGRGLRTPINLHELGWYNVVESKLTSVLGLTFGIMKIHSASYCSTSWKLLLSLFGFKHAGLQIQTSG